MRNALLALRMTGVCGYVGIQQGPLVLEGIDTVGKTVLGILEGSVDPQTFIPRMIELWQAGDFPFDRLIETFPMSEINEAEQSSLSGGVIKPVLLPCHARRMPAGRVCHATRAVRSARCSTSPVRSPPRWPHRTTSWWPRSSASGGRGCTTRRRSTRTCGWCSASAPGARRRSSSGRVSLVPSLRHPMTTAAAIGTLVELAPGRVNVAIGSGFTGRLTLGQKPLPWAFVREYVIAVQGLLAGETVEWEGAPIRMMHPDGFGAPRPIRVPIILGTGGPKGEGVAHELADGIFTTSPRGRLRPVLDPQLRHRARRRRGSGRRAGDGRGRPRRRTRLPRRPPRWRGGDAAGWRSLGRRARGVPRAGTPPGPARGPPHRGQRTGPAGDLRRRR